MKQTFILAAFLVIASCLPLSVRAQTPPPAPKCTSEEKSHQFDFWLGNWEVTAGDQVAGYNNIIPLLDGCVIMENLEGASGSKGSSFNFYNPTTDEWEQFWVWRNGTKIHTKGHFEDGKMILQGESTAINGQTTLNRITWSANEEGHVRQFWEVSSDGGETWTVGFDGLYKPRVE